MIDVRELIARYSNSEHVSRADAYFSAIPDDGKLLRKPFFGIDDTQLNMHGVAEVLQRLRLFPGARVLDFGAGTGWFSRMLAFLECEAFAVDVSATALGLGQRAFQRDPLAAGLSVHWRPYDGATLPVPDGAIDRIVSYDAFHHVADQAATLREFHRVLADGGRIVFHEPGPDHSNVPSAQYEMRRHAVIENDVVVEDIWAIAQDVGFGNLEVALTTPHTLSLPLDRYARIVAGEAAPEDVAGILQCIAAGAGDLRIFSMTKGHEALDSRRIAGLAGSYDIEIAAVSGGVVRGSARVTNTGSTPWLPSAAAVGGVSLGVHWPDVPGTHFGRISLSDAVIRPGQAVTVAFCLALPITRPTRLTFDLVAEQVTWFEPIGSQPVYVDIG